ncbi:MAG: phytase [Gammaproteobacteria bacterium]
MARRMPHRFVLPALVVIAAACSPVDRIPDAVSAAQSRIVAQRVLPSAETVPVATEGDAADDPAIWVHPTDPAQSLVIGTDKQRGLQVYDLEGRLLQELPDGRLNNVDLREGFLLDGRATILVAATNRSDQTIALYELDTEQRRLRRLGRGLPTGFTEPYGLCLYASRFGDHYVFVNEAVTGRTRQLRLTGAGGGVTARLVREFDVGSQAEGCAADDELAELYVAEEDRALWKYAAEPGGGSARTLIDLVGGANGLVADIEGVAIWRGKEGRGFIVVSNQGADSYAVYRRESGNSFVGQFLVGDNAPLGVDGTVETDGLDVTSQAAGPQFPDGLLVVQDGRNEPAGSRQNFKLVSWRVIAEALRLPHPG